MKKIKLKKRKKLNNRYVRVYVTREIQQVNGDENQSIDNENVSNALHH